jgi:UDP-N-acetylglucosamine 2-epimerase
MKKIVSIVGARPQFIKAALISKKLRAAGCVEILIHTGQHYDFNMSDIFFKQLQIPEPDYYLGIGSGLHGEQTGKMLVEIERVLIVENPDVVIIYGDTNTTLAGALASSKLHIPVAHVEAGLRSFNKKMPEEINRVLADHVSNILFCPTETAVHNLQKENFINIINMGKLIELPLSSKELEIMSCEPHSSQSFHDPSPVVINTGDVMYDIALQLTGNINEKEVLEKYDLEQKNYILATIHRPENTDFEASLKNIWDSMEEIAQTIMPVFFPLHPRTLNALKKMDILNKNNKAKIKMNEPVSYLEMLVLEKNAKIIVTDSGGVQKEAYFFQTPCVIIRGQSEWVELIESGWAKLSKPARENIKAHCLGSLDDGGHIEWQPYYGDGKASERIVKIIASYSS